MEIAPKMKGSWQNASCLSDYFDGGLQMNEKEDLLQF